MTNDQRPPTNLSRRNSPGASLYLGAGIAGSPGATEAHAVAPGEPAPSTLREKVAQLFVVSFAGTSPNTAFLQLLERTALGGVILFNRNCTSAAQVRRLVSGLQRAAPFPLLVAIDQEGGTVIRLREGVKTFPSEEYYGALRSIARVTEDAAITAVELRALGINANLAPVVDVLGNSLSPIGTRSYGPDAALDARLGAAAIHSYQRNGMAATAKHFIGLGHTLIDSHHALPTVDLSLAQLEQADMLPFRAAVSAHVSSILVAHVALPAIDPSHTPATLSKPIIGGLVRKRLGFKGVVITDSLLMGALPPGQESQAAERALRAGADLLLYGTNRDFPFAVIEDAIDRIVAAVGARRISERRLDSAVARVLSLKRRFNIL